MKNDTLDPTATAKDFYKRLNGQGFTREQVVDLATRLLDHVHADLREQRRINVSK